MPSEIGEDQLVLLPIRPVHILKILQQRKKYEYRPVYQFGNVKCSKIIIYCCHPVMMIIGELDIIKPIDGSRTLLWKKTGHLSGFDNKKDFFKALNKEVKYRAFKISNIYLYKKLLYSINMDLKMISKPIFRLSTDREIEQARKKAQAFCVNNPLEYVTWFEILVRLSRKFEELKDPYQKEVMTKKHLTL